MEQVSSGPDFSAVPGEPHDAKRPKVVLVTLNYLPEGTGIAAYTTSLAEGLAEAGFPVEVIAAAPHYPQWKTLPRDQWSGDETRNGVRVRRVRSYVPTRPTWLRRALFEVLYGMRLGTRVPRDGALVILVSPGLFTSGVVGAIMRLRRLTGRRVLWVQDRYVTGVNEVAANKGNLATRAVGATAGYVLRRSDDVVVIHERWRREIADQFALPLSKIHVIRNWTHISMPEDLDRSAERKRLGWGTDRDETVVLHAGNMGVKQGLENVIQAAQLAERTGAPVRFVLMGDGNQRTSLEQMAHGCRAIQFLPPQDMGDYVRLLDAADVLLVNEKPGMLSSAVPSKLTSYFATGRPVVAATEAEGVTADEVRASRAGVVIEPGSPEALLQAVQAVAMATEGTLDGGPDYVRRVLSRESAIRLFSDLTHNKTSTPDSRVAVH